MVDDVVINDDDDVTIGEVVTTGDAVTTGEVVTTGHAVTIGEVVTTGNAVICVGKVVGGMRIASGSHIRPALLKKATSAMLTKSELTARVNCREMICWEVLIAVLHMLKRESQEVSIVGMIRPTILSVGDSPVTKMLIALVPIPHCGQLNITSRTLSTPV